MEPLEFIEFAEWVVENRPLKEFQLYDIRTMCDLVTRRDKVTDLDEFYIRTVGAITLKGGHFPVRRNTGVKKQPAKAKQEALF